MATNDILSLLKPGHDNFNSMPDDFYLKLATREISIAPRYWDTYESFLKAIPFEWVEVKYTDLDSHLKVPANGNGIGVYLFAVKPSSQIVDLPGHIFYVGIAGEGGSGRHLRERLRQYIQVSSVKKRTKVQNALELYHQHTYVLYSKLSVSGKKLSEIETNLHGFFLPWANERDFPTNIKHAKKAFNI